METIRTAEIEQIRAIDTRIAAAWEKFYNARDLVAKYEKWVAYYPADSAQGMRYRFKFEDANAKMQAAKDEVAAMEKNEYRGWTRFFLVQHIHNTMHCSSFRWNTRIGWLPNVSGLTEQEAVAEYGATLCTKCFKSAPVE